MSRFYALSRRSCIFFILRILTALFYNPDSGGAARQIHNPENAAFGFRFAAKSDTLPCSPTGVF